MRADRLVLQALKDSLIHALRNAVHHGIEPAAERLRSGKPAVGQIALILQADGNRLTIEVRDDGRGLDLVRVAELAAEREVPGATDAANRGPDDLARLLFQPGFSTAEEVTEVAGRGMGLSVVQEAVTRLQGEATLGPASGGGTELRISVPLSIATHRLLLVACSGQSFALPVHAVERLFRVPLQDAISIEGVPHLRLMERADGTRSVPATMTEHLTPLASLSQLLGFPAEPVPATEHRPLVVLRSGAKRLAVVVDGFIALREALLKPLAPPASKLKQYAGAMLLEDGSVCLVLNPWHLVEQTELLAQPVVFEPASPRIEPRIPTVLVVDDSFTTRTLETSILETRGYVVRSAVDGVEALSRLRAEKIDLVITDLQMPRLDGFGLLAEMKQDQRLAHIPVIIVSSMDRREDQQRGLSLGADAYIVKRKFDHQELLQAVEQIL